MTEATLRVSQGEVSAEEILDRLKGGQRVIVERELLGSVFEVTLRFEGGTYYCDTPTTLHRHETEEGMRACLEGQRYGGG